MLKTAAKRKFCGGFAVSMSFRSMCIAVIVLLKLLQNSGKTTKQLKIELFIVSHTGTSLADLQSV